MASYKASGCTAVQQVGLITYCIITAGQPITQVMQMQAVIARPDNMSCSLPLNAMPMSHALVDHISDLKAARVSTGRAGRCVHLHRLPDHRSHAGGPLCVSVVWLEGGGSSDAAPHAAVRLSVFWLLPFWCSQYCICLHRGNCRRCHPGLLHALLNFIVIPSCTMSLLNS